MNKLLALIALVIFFAEEYRIDKYEAYIRNQSNDAALYQSLYLKANSRLKVADSLLQRSIHY